MEVSKKKVEAEGTVVTSLGENSPPFMTSLEADFQNCVSMHIGEMCCIHNKPKVDFC